MYMVDIFLLFACDNDCGLIIEMRVVYIYKEVEYHR